MAYEPKHNFRRKDYLSPGDPDKIIYGSDLQDEFDAISGDLEKIEVDLESVEGGAASWDELTGKPSTFPPQAHTHSQSQITGLEGRLQQMEGADAALDLRIDAVEDSITDDGGFVDAPNDNKLYGRKSENWEEIVLTGGSGAVYTLPILLRSGDAIQLPLSDDGEHLTVMLRAGEIDLPLEAA